MSYGYIVTRTAADRREVNSWQSGLSSARVLAAQTNGAVYKAALGEMVCDFRPPTQCPAKWTANARCWLHVHSDPDHVSLDGASIRAWHGGQGLDRDPRKISPGFIARAVREHDEREAAK